MFFDYFTLCFWTISLYIFVKIKDRPSLDGLNAKLGSHRPTSDRLLIHFGLSAYYFEKIMQILEH